jgi:hypothetical protein
MKNALTILTAFLFVGNTLFTSVPALEPLKAEAVASRSISLENRAAPKSLMNEVMKDNILLTLSYMRGMPVSASPDWEAVRKPFDFSFELKPGETYAFQKDSLPEYKNSVAKTIDVNFAEQDGYKHDGYLMGDGVCHLASLIYWTAKDAGLKSTAPTNHDFMAIPEIPREYGVSIYSMPGNPEANSQQNLYVKNNEPDTIKLGFKYDGKKIEVRVISEKTASSILTQTII